MSMLLMKSRGPLMCVAAWILSGVTDACRHVLRYPVTQIKQPTEFSMSKVLGWRTVSGATYIFIFILCSAFWGVKPQGCGGWKAKGTEELALDLLQIMATQETPVSLSSQCPAPQPLFPAILLLISSFTVPGFLLVTLLTLAIAFCFSLFMPEIRLELQGFRKQCWGISL